MTTAGRRSRRAISADIRECAAIWFRRAEELFGDQTMVGDFNHAVECAKRFETALTEVEKSKLGRPSIADVRQGPSARASAA